MGFPNGFQRQRPGHIDRGVASGSGQIALRVHRVTSPSPHRRPERAERPHDLDGPDGRRPGISRVCRSPHLVRWQAVGSGLPLRCYCAAGGRSAALRGIPMSTILPLWNIRPSPSSMTTCHNNLLPGYL